ncbi:MAG: HPP family protein [Actinomycetota bacterium]
MNDEVRYPIGGRMSDVVLGLGRRFHLPALVRRHNSTAVMGLFAFVNGSLSIGIMAGAAFVTRQPFIFPSLGPTAFLLFYTPNTPAASPRNTLVGHLIGTAAGYLSLAVFGLLHAGPAIAVGVSAGRVGAAAMSLGLTAGLMVWLKVPHPPAGATTLIVSLGVLAKPIQLVVLMLGVLLLVLQGIIINRLAGLDYPLWGPKKS